jgi:hypothetical protein
MLNATNGAVVRQFRWKGDAVWIAVSTPTRIFAALRGAWPPDGKSQVASLGADGTQFSTIHDGFCPSLSYSRQTNLLYKSDFNGLTVCRPATLDTACKIDLKPRGEGLGIVDVNANKIYAMTNQGYVYALRHPRV